MDSLCCSIPDLSETLDYTRDQSTSKSRGAATYAFQVPERDTGKNSGAKTAASTEDTSTLSKYVVFNFGATIL